MPPWAAGTEKNPLAVEASAAPLVPPGPDSFCDPTAKAKGELQPAGGACPKCASTAVYVSRARSAFERTLERWRAPICRCHRCYHRYVVFARLKIGKETPVVSAKQAKRERSHG